MRNINYFVSIYIKRQNKNPVNFLNIIKEKKNYF